MNQYLPKLFVTIVSAGLLVYQLNHKSIDPVALGLIALLLLPWLGSILDLAELPGGVKFTFKTVDRIERKQLEQDQQLKWIQEVLVMVLSDHERQHLQNFLSPEPFIADIHSNFEWELRHLLTQNFIDRVSGKGMNTLKNERDNVKNHFNITERGKHYLKLIQGIV